MAVEIEFKFLVDTKNPDLQALLSDPTLEHHTIAQGYLNTDPDRIVRIRLQDTIAFLTIKGRPKGLTRPEFEYSIPFQDAQDMLAMCPKILRKNRTVIPVANGLKWEIDVFDDIPLILAEIEVPDESTPFERPAWLGKDVSTDPAYANSSLLEKI